MELYNEIWKACQALLCFPCKILYIWDPTEDPAQSLIEHPPEAISRRPLTDNQRCKSAPPL